MNAAEPAPPVIPRRPYPGVESYSYADRQIFFARETEARKLAAHITIYRSVLLYGVSGTGKSSLINAAVFPLVIEDGFSPERIRVQPRTGEEIVIERIPATREPTGPYLPSVFAGPSDAVSRLVLSVDMFRERLCTLPADAYPLLIFDQFEEFVSLFEEAPRGSALRPAIDSQARVKDLLLDLARDTTGRFKLLFVFREDYLAKLSEFFVLIPDLRNRYVRLAPPVAAALPAIIRGPFLAFPGAFFPEIPESLATQLSDEFSTRAEAGAVNLSEVQIACSRLWHSTDPTKEFEERGLQGLLEDSLSAALERMPEDLRDPAVALLGRMVTDAGLRNVISRDDLLARAHKEEGFDLNQLENSLEALVTDTKLVRKERRRDVLFFEIISEFLVPWIGRQRVLRQMMRQRRRTRAVIVGLLCVSALVVIALLRSRTLLSSRLEEATIEIGALRGDDINFLSIITDRDTVGADTRLKRFLEKAVAAGIRTTAAVQEPGTTRFPLQTMPYGDVIRALAEAGSERPYLARITPYAFVAAEMLGAKLNILAVYRSSATSETIYHSYFVVRKDSFRAQVNWNPASGDASVEDIEKYLRSFKTPPKFMYHDRFSTSSYFIPLLYFKAREVFASNQTLNSIVTPIEVERLATTSSSDLVQRVVDRKADLVAVWDGPKKKWESHPELLFIQIPTPIPNDLLVASGISAQIQRSIVNAIQKDPSADRPCTDLPVVLRPSAVNSDVKVRTPCESGTVQPTDDFDAWYAWDRSTDWEEVTDAAREALAKLRHDARPQPTPLVVRIETKPAGGDAGNEALLEAYVNAAKQATRYSEAELVLEDKNLHKRVDLTWTLEPTHDGAVRLVSRLDSTLGLPPESFELSFVDSADLSHRIADVAHWRMRRIRFVWPYEQRSPIVLRDFPVTPADQVIVQKVLWMDPKSNEYETEAPFSALITDADSSKLILSEESRFPRNPDGSFNFDPLSNVTFRVVITAALNPSWIWIILPYCSLALMVLAAAGLVLDFRRRNQAVTDFVTLDRHR